MFNRYTERALQAIGGGMRTLNRQQWQALCDEMLGETDEESTAEVRVSPNGVYVERFGGVSSVDVLGSYNATHVRIRSVQVLVDRDRIVVLSHRGKYPVKEWAVLYDGPIHPVESEEVAA